MNQPAPNQRLSRRYFLNDCAVGLGKIAAASLLASGAHLPRVLGCPNQSPNDIGELSPKPPHFQATAKAVIHLFMAGAPVSWTCLTRSQH